MLKTLTRNQGMTTAKQVRADEEVVSQPVQR